MDADVDHPRHHDHQDPVLGTGTDAGERQRPGRDHPRCRDGPRLPGRCRHRRLSVAPESRRSAHGQCRTHGDPRPALLGRGWRGHADRGQGGRTRPALRRPRFADPGDRFGHRDVRDRLRADAPGRYSGDRRDHCRDLPAPRLHPACPRSRPRDPGRGRVRDPGIPAARAVCRIPWFRPVYGCPDHGATRDPSSYRWEHRYG